MRQAGNRGGVDQIVGQMVFYAHLLFGDGNIMKDRVEAVINRIRPAVQMDGGDIELIDVVDGTVKLRLVGACSGCPSATATLRAGIERAIQSEVPEIKGVEAVAE